MKSSAFHCAPASVSSDTLKIDPPVCCVMAVGLLITSASASLSPRHRTRNEDKAGYDWMLGNESIERTRGDNMMPKEKKKIRDCTSRSQECQLQQRH